MSGKSDRPASVMVFGILQIIFGALSLLGTGGAFASLAGATDSKVNMPSPSGNGPGMTLDLEQEFANRIPIYPAYRWFAAFAALISTGLMLTSGIGLVQWKAWSRRIALIWALFYMALSLATFLFNLLFLVPAGDAIANQLEKQPVPGPQLALVIRMSTYGQMLLIPVFQIYPGLLLLFMTRRAVTDAFAAKDSPRDDDRDRDRYDDRDRDRDRYDDRDRDRDRYDDRDEDRGGIRERRDPDAPY